MELSKIIKYLDKKFNPKLAANWDHSGFQIFNKLDIDMNRDINNILVCLDVNSDVIDKAISSKTELIISRHPFIFNDLKIEKKNKRELINSLTENNIYVYSIHTNYDASPNQDLLDLINNELPISKNKRFGIDKEGYEITLKQELDPQEFIKKINSIFETDVCQLNTNFDMDNKIDKFYIVTGAGGSAMLENNMNNEIFVTGEAKWNELVYANDNSMSIILKGHYMEQYFVDDIANKLENAFETINIEKFDIKNQIKDYD